MLLILGFIYARTSNRCKSKRRAHDEDVESQRRSGPGYVKNMYMLKTIARPGARKEDSYVEKEKKEVSHKSKKRTKKSSKRRKPRITYRWKKPQWRPNISLRIRKRGTGTTAFLGRGLRSFQLPWKTRGPRRVFEIPSSGDEPSVCGEVFSVEKPSDLNADSISYCSSSCSCCSSSDDDAPEDLLSTSKPKKAPPPRPPSPKISSKKSKLRKTKPTSERNDRRKNSASSGYSSEEDKDAKKKKRHRRSKRQKRRKTKNRKKTMKEKTTPKPPSSNPFDNYPVSATDRQYQDFENDYRKNGHIFDGIKYNPQYHLIKSYPVKPVHKPLEKDNDLEEKEKPQVPAPKGGVKYYTIKQDDEIEKMKRKQRRSRSQSTKHKKRKSSSSRKRDKSRSKSPKKRKSSKRRSGESTGRKK